MQKIPNWQQPTYKILFKTDQKLRDSDSLFYNAANNRYSQNGNGGFEEEILNVTNHHPRDVTVWLDRSTFLLLL
jgi:hypothetical protein